MTAPDETPGKAPAMRSLLRIFDLDTGRAETLLDHAGHIEAPNWAPDGASLIVNGGGRLFRLPLDAPRLVPIDTGSLSALNNDHGISPDGRTLVVSNSPNRGTSLIYTLPATGGEPRLVTPKAPSWWHGWSPDGARLAYTCLRDGRFGIATIPLEGGPETVLISGPHHYDGPDYSPDGAHVWFNSDRGGSMDLWRMSPDGTGAEPMTSDDRVNWFPHPAPDGRHVLYLSYLPGTQGHPANRPVELRLLDLATARTSVLAGFLGGQGTLNVPSWAPDGRRFAFVQYRVGRP